MQGGKKNRDSISISPNYTDCFETPEPHSLNGKPPIEALVPDTSRGGRAGRKFGLSTADTWSAKMRNAQDGLAMTRRRLSQEIANSFWSYSYGGLSQVYV
jgi:hypothetical protein